MVESQPGQLLGLGYYILLSAQTNDFEKEKQSSPQAMR